MQNHVQTIAAGVDDERPVETLLGAGERAVPGFTEPSDASIAGLLHVADRQEKKALVLNRHQGLLEGAKERAKAVINEYF